MTRERTALHPDSRLPRLARRNNPKFGRSANHAFFQHAYVPNHVSPDCTEVQDGIAHNLARTMIGDIAATTGLMEFHAFLSQNVLAHEQVLAFSISALGNDMRSEERRVGKESRCGGSTC